MKIGYRFLETLESHGVIHGRVVYVFDNTVDIVFKKDLFAITYKPYGSPYTINLERQPYHRLFNGSVRTSSRVSIMYGSKGTVFRVNGRDIILDISRANIYKPHSIHIIGSIDSRIATHIQLAKRYIDILSKILGLCINDQLVNLVDKAIDNVRQYLTKYLDKTIGINRLKDQLIRYIGLGEGFTPAYDDYLAGLLAGANYYMKLLGKPFITIDLEKLHGKTNIVSLKMIEYSMRLELIEPLDNLLTTILGGREPRELMEKIIDILTIGWSSGYYMAHGLLDSLETISQNIMLQDGRKQTHHP